MIDLGLSKIAIIGVVALIVIGPEKLPKVARMVGSLYGRAQRYLSEVKSEVSREIELEELRSIQKEVQDAAHSIRSDVETSMAQNIAEIESDWRDTPSISATPEHLTHKAREFRRKKLLRSSAIPAWYKQRHGGKMHVMSGAARVAKYRPGAKSHSSFY